MTDPIEANRRLWDARTPIHVQSRFYDVDGFRAGRDTLHAVEVAEVGDVRGKTLLHLQCHFGLDTLSWARRGATVTGVDFSGEAIRAARALAAECGIDATFIESDVLALGDVLDGEFDVVFTSYGALTWLPDLRPWARAAARFVKPGGFLYVAEIHPMAAALLDAVDEPELVVGYPYRTSPDAPLRFEEPGTYADFDADICLPEYCWQHGVADMLGSVIEAGLVLDHVAEHDAQVYPQLPFLEEGDDGLWRLPEGMPNVPFVLSFRARKPGR